MNDMLALLIILIVTVFLGWFLWFNFYRKDKPKIGYVTSLAWALKQKELNVGTTYFICYAHLMVTKNYERTYELVFSDSTNRIVKIDKKSVDDWIKKTTYYNRHIYPWLNGKELSSHDIIDCQQIVHDCIKEHNRILSENSQDKENVSLPEEQTTVSKEYEIETGIPFNLKYEKGTK